MPFTIGTLTLAVTDGSTGGSPAASASVGGGTNGRTVNLYRAPWTGQGGARQWTLAGTGTVSGTTATIADGAAAFGYYEWLAVQLTAGGDGASLSNITYRPVTDPDAKSVWEQCVDHTALTIASLLLPGLTSDKVQSGWLPSHPQNINPKPPAVWCAPYGAETYPANLNDKDDVGLPVLVLMVDNIDKETRKNFNRNLLWREKISRALRYQKPPGIAEVFYTEINPDTVVHPDAWDDGLWASAVLFRFLSREARGIY